MMSSRWRRREEWSAPAWARPTTGCRGEPFVFHHPHTFEWCWICLLFCITAIEIVCLSRKYTPPYHLSFVIMFFDVREREKLRRLQALPPIRSTNVPISPSVWELWRGGPSAERSEFWKGDAKTWDFVETWCWLWQWKLWQGGSDGIWQHYSCPSILQRVDYGCAWQSCSKKVNELTHHIANGQ